jgi:rhodanese-related sulfurtransferase
MSEAVTIALTAVPVGLAFGFILERAGLGDPRVIGGQLTGRDFTVVRVMFGAILTAMLGLFVAGAVGLTDPGSVAVPPTDVVAQALGAVIFGGGFAMAALCPGTACVAAASGRRDGVAAVLGVFGGTLLTPVVWPLVDPVVQTVPREGATLGGDLGLSTGIVVGVLTVLGVGAFMLARWFETRASRWWVPTRVESVALTLGLLMPFLAAGSRTTPAALADIAREIEREQDHVDPLDLATWIREGKPGLRVVDVRDHLDTADYRIPGAIDVPLAKIASLRIRDDEEVVLYSDGGTHAAQGWVLLRARGVRNAKILKDGMAAWEDEVLSPIIPVAADDSTVQRFNRARDLSIWFGGRPRTSSAPFLQATRAAQGPRPRRRNTC